MRIKSQMPIGVTAGAKTCRKCGVLCCFPHRIDGYVGVGVTQKDGGYAVKINLAAAPPTDTLLPESVDGVPIVCEIVGRLTKQ